jgi:hypothetical protein
MHALVIPAQLRVEALRLHDGSVTILASPGAAAAPCPVCGQRSRRVHSRYARTIADLPWAGQPVQLRLTVRKFRCENANCPRRIFAERLAGVAAAYARRTGRQRGALEALGLAVGGEAGARLATALGLPAIPDTDLRCVQGAEEG